MRVCGWFAFFLALAWIAPGAQAAPWSSSEGHTQVPIWPGAAPDLQPAPGPEHVKTVTKSPVAGRPWLNVTNVSRPTMTVYSPRENNTGVAVVVFPGGGYQILAIDLEGTEVCEFPAGLRE